MNDLPDLDGLLQWVGRTESVVDVLTPRLVAAYIATVQDREVAPVAGDAAPPGIHWCLSPTTAPMSKIGEDGHPTRGNFLPPIPLPRRMWAGSRIDFAAPLRVGDTVERRSSIANVRVRQGRSGVLCFVTVAHSYATEHGQAIHEEQDLVYREAAGHGPAPEPKDPAATGETRPPALTRMVKSSFVLLFRFSALTFNGHRIHYDEHYAREVEGYQRLVVHGPLQAALLLDLASRMHGGDPARRFECRAKRPLLADEPIVLNGNWRDDGAAELWTGSARTHAFLIAVATW